jgi:hypothetical protein
MTQQRTQAEIWGEIVRTAYLVASHQRSAGARAFEDYLVEGHAGGESQPLPESARQMLVELGSDAQILTRLISELDKTRPFS